MAIVNSIILHPHLMEILISITLYMFLIPISNNQMILIKIMHRVFKMILDSLKKNLKKDKRMEKKKEIKMLLLLINYLEKKKIWKMN